MKTLAMLATTIGFILGLGGAVQAANLFTPSLGVGGTDDFHCRILNVSAHARTVQILIKSASGVTVKDSGQVPVEAGSAFADGVSDPSGAVYCHFITEGPKSNWRGVGCIAGGAAGTSTSRDCVAAQ